MVGGAPVVCLIGASYVTTLTGGGLVTRAAVAAGLLVVVLALAAGGPAGERPCMQVVLVSVLIGTVVVAVAGSASAARVANWTPFVPHGWLSVGHAATTLMLSFVGWEAVAPLTTRFADPSRQLPRVIGIALAATTALYLSIAVAVIGVLGPGAATSVPLADLLRRSIGVGWRGGRGRHRDRAHARHHQRLRHRGGHHGARANPRGVTVTAPEPSPGSWPRSRQPGSCSSPCTARDW